MLVAPLMTPIMGATLALVLAAGFVLYFTLGPPAEPRPIAERERAALQTRREIKALELRSLEYEAERNQKFFQEGGLFSQDEVRKAENDAEKARLELRQIDEIIGS